MFAAVVVVVADDDAVVAVVCVFFFVVCCCLLLMLCFAVVIRVRVLLQPCSRACSCAVFLLWDCNSTCKYEK